MAGVGLVRLRKEMKMLANEPPPGVCAWPVDDCISHLQAQIQGPEDSPYERGTFVLDLQIPERYPFEPPKVRFVTPIYHPNIDSGGRICLDTLKMRPAGSWAPSMNVATLLTTIRLLMAHPNGDDGLMPDITDMFVNNPSKFAEMTRAHVEQHARQDATRSHSAASNKGGATAAVGLTARVAGGSGMTDVDPSSCSRQESAGKSQTVTVANQDKGNSTPKPGRSTTAEGREHVTSDKQKNEGRSSGARRAGNEADAELATEKTGAANTSAGRIEGTSAEEGTDATVAREEKTSNQSNRSSCSEEVRAASSDDGEWSDESDEEHNPKRARTSP